jgi:hypothetical protein
MLLAVLTSPGEGQEEKKSTQPKHIEATFHRVGSFGKKLYLET